MRRRTIRLAMVLAAWAGFGCDPAAPAPAGVSEAPRPWAVLPWGEAAGRVDGQEAASEGPKSFAVLPDGGIVVLDQVHRRILRLDAAGHAGNAIELPRPTFDDVEQFEGRAVLALERLGAGVLLALDLEGALLAEVAVEGRGIERAGMVTAMLSRPDGVWLEVDHRHSVRVLDRDLRPCDRRIVLGRPIANGRSLRAALDGRGGVDVSLGGRVERLPERSVSLKGDGPVERIVWFDADAAGRVHVILDEVERSAVPPYDVSRERYLLVVLDEGLREIGRAESPWVLTRYDQSVEFRVGPDGRVWQMVFADDGVRLLDWGRRAP